MDHTGLAHVAETFALCVIVVGLLHNSMYALQLALAARALAKAPVETDSEGLWRRYAEVAPPVSVLVPAFNEAATIVQAVRALLTMRYPNFEIVVVNDGSSDTTLDVLIDAFALIPKTADATALIATAPVKGLYVSRVHPRLLVVDKQNGGKADALNAAINSSRAPLFCAIDSDSILEPDALLRVVQPFLEDPQQVIACGGAVRVGNGCRADHGHIADARAPRHPLALIQAVEYVRALLLARLGLSSIGALTIISGAFGVFRRSAVIEVGGYDRGTVGEDMELVLRLHRRFREWGRAYRIAFAPEPACWTEAPERLDVLARQRRRWQRGAIESCQRHARMAFNPRYGSVGFAGMGAVFIIDIAGPMAELAGYALLPVFAALGLLSFDYFVAFLGLNIVFGIALSVAALSLDDAELRRVRDTRDLLLLLAAAVGEAFGYRQLSALWRLQGVADWAWGARDWGAMARKGFRTGG